MAFLYDPYTGKPIQPRGYSWPFEPQPMPPSQQAQPESKDPWTMVPSLADVDKVSVERGETKWIMVQSDPIFAVKTANAMGYAPAEYYRFEQIDPAALSQPTPLPGGQTLTREDVEHIVEEKAQSLIGQYLSTMPAAPTRAKKEASHE